MILKKMIQNLLEVFLNKRPLVVMLLILSMGVTAQNKSLSRLIKESNSSIDSIRIESLGKLSFKYLHQDMDSAKMFIHLFFDAAVNSGDTHQIARGHYYKAIYHYYQGNLDSAIFMNKKTLTVYEKTNYLKGVAGCTNLMAQLFKGQARYDSALIYYQKSLEVAKISVDSVHAATVLGNISVLYSNALGD
ncbi:MAG: tetratricopeptide repeat protein, partial [Bacteroidota bacterium]